VTDGSLVEFEVLEDVDRECQSLSQFDFERGEGVLSRCFQFSKRVVRLCNNSVPLSKVLRTIIGRRI
jgi:hypothetical protein